MASSKNNHHHDASPRPRERAARLGVVIDTLRNEVVVARQDPGESLRVTRYPSGDPLSRLAVGEIAMTSLSAGAFTNPVSAEVVPPGLDGDAITEKLAETIERDPAWVLSRSPEEVACNWASNSAGQVVITEAESRFVEEALTDCRDFIAAAEIVKAPSFRVRVETPLRALVRFCAAECAPLAQQPETATAAFLFITKAGYGVGLWSRRMGLAHETEQGLAPELTAEEIGEQAADFLSGLLSPSSLKDFGLGPATLLLVALAPDLPESLIAEIGERLSGLEVKPLLPVGEGPRYELSEMLAMGLLCPAERLAELDLADDLRPRAERIIARRQTETATRRTQIRRKAALALMAPFLVLCGACSAPTSTLRTKSRTPPTSKRERSRKEPGLRPPKASGARPKRTSNGMSRRSIKSLSSSSTSRRLSSCSWIWTAAGRRAIPPGASLLYAPRHKEPSRFAATPAARRRSRSLSARLSSAVTSPGFSRRLKIACCRQENRRRRTSLPSRRLNSV